MSDRAEYIKGLRALADVLESNPGAELPYYGAARPIPVYLATLGGHDPLAGALAYIAAMNGRPTLTFEDHEEKPNYWLQVEGWVRGCLVQVILRAHEVCEVVDGEPVIPPTLHVERGEASVRPAGSYIEEITDPRNSPERLRQIHFELKQTQQLGQLVTNEVGDDEPIGQMVVRIGKERSSNG